MLCRFKKYAEKLKTEPHELWDALVQDAEVESPNWIYAEDRRRLGKLSVNLLYPFRWSFIERAGTGYLPVDDFSDTAGMNTRQVSRTLEASVQNVPIEADSNTILSF